MELLAPAGNLEKLKTAVLYGANAVYLAGQKYSLRGASDNFSNSEIEEGIKFARDNNCKIYATLNAFLHDKELDDLSKYIKILEDCGVDAVIVSDIGVMTLVQENSNLPIHVSTQSSCLNSFSAKFWKNLGAKRLILGREVSLDEARIIKNEVNIEVELFIHGSMCMSYSGNCTISNYTAGRDSNRGGCIQSCRIPYSVVSAKSEKEIEKYEKNSESILSSKDLRGLAFLPEFLKSGVDSIKIEGRMKSSLYVATTSSVYSRAIKICKENSQKEIKKQLSNLSLILEQMPNRGYTSGFLNKTPDSYSTYLGNRNSRNSGYEFAGTVMEVEINKSCTILLRKSVDNNSILEILNFDGTISSIHTKEMKTLSNKAVLRTTPNCLIRLPLCPKSVDGNDFSGNSRIQRLNVVRIKTQKN